MFPCAGPWKTATLNWDGRLTVCCRDIDLKLCLGNLKEKSFSDLWFGKKITKIRISHIKGKYKKLEPCNNCTGLDGPIITKKELTEYVESIGRNNLKKFIIKNKKVKLL